MADLWVECGELAAGARACAAGEPPAEEERAGFGHWAEPVRIGWDQRSGTRVRVLDRWPGEDHCYFRVQDAAGAIYILRHQEDPASDWRLVYFQSPEG